VVVPGSETIRREAEAEGIDQIFRDAGFQWREAGCSMCLAANGETIRADSVRSQPPIAISSAAKDPALVLISQAPSWLPPRR